MRVTQPMLAVLQAFLDANGDELHGWAIMKTTKCAGPTVYKILERLAEAEWITARWEVLDAEANRPRRRFYSLTPNGTIGAREILARRATAPLRKNWLPAFGCDAR
jgi:PadR family transcriptional regulator PadR